MRRLILILLLMAAAPARAQTPAADYRGVAATGLALRELATTKRVLMIAAHPDDEDTQLLSVLGLGHGADVAYLSLTRGEGGQNSIGGERGPALGVLRTGELLAARSLDRADQFFTRAYDFGYSKTAEETLSHWPRDSILSDVVAVIRRYRPDIIVAVFSGTPRDGHGHHQVSGIIAREAFDAAADPKRFPQQLRAGLRPHRAQKLFQSANFRGTPTHRLPTGVWDQLLGRSYSQVAAASRSRHRSQDFGLLQAPGPRTTALALERSLTAVGANGSIFSGIDTTLGAKAARAGQSAAVARTLQRFDSLIASARAQLNAYDSQAVTDEIAAALRQLDTALTATSDEELQFAIMQEQRSGQRALMQAAGVFVDAWSSTEAIVPGEPFELALTVWNGGQAAIRITALHAAVPRGWQSERLDSVASEITAGAIDTARFRIAAPGNAAVTQPYFLVHPKVGDTYAWPASEIAGTPFGPAPVQAVAVLEIGGSATQISVAATRRLLDPRQGELRRLVHVTPAFTVRPDPATAVMTLARLTTGQHRVIDVNVEVASNGGGGRVVVRPQLPSGWRAVPAERPLDVGARSTHMARFAVEPPANAAAGRYEIGFAATDSAGRTYDLTQRNIDYPHIGNRALYEPARLSVQLLDARLARGMRVGYIVGMDADVPPVLEQLGMAVDLLDAHALANADLRQYDAVVIGSRAYEVRRDLVLNNARVLDYGRRGGHVLVLYQQYEMVQGNFMPYPFMIERPHDRITDENAPVRVLPAGSPALSRPNRIDASDFGGWVQERALYMPRTWAAEYTPLLEMRDAGEAPKQGAVITAALGEGRYTYTGIAFFRQIPAAVPGALRLFINLLSLGMDDAAF